MTVQSRKKTKYLGLFTALTVILALIGFGTANAAVSGLTLTPDSDTIPAGNCNAFTVTLSGASQTETVGQTIDVEVRDTDTNNANTPQDETQSPVSFCTPDSTGTNANYNQTGPNPRAVDTNGNMTLNADSFCETTAAQPRGCNGTISGETGTTTDANSTDTTSVLTFGVISNDAGTYSVTAYYDANNNDTKDAGEFSDTSTKTFTARTASSQCSDGADNDGDGKIDFGAGPNNDPGCTAASDNDETDPSTNPVPNQCEDGKDNDGDGLIDFGSDGGCKSRTDNDETGSGNRRLATAVTIRYNKPVHAFKGTLANAAKKCRVNRKVALYRKRPGKDRVIKTTTTNQKGTYLMGKRHVQGKTWYVVARAKQFANPNGGTTFCLKGRSVNLRIARR